MAIMKSSTNDSDGVLPDTTKSSGDDGGKKRITVPFVLGAVVVAISQFQIGFTVSFTNVSQQLADEYFDVIRNASSESPVSTGDQTMLWSLIISLLNVGACFGSLLAGPYADRFCRKKAMWALNICSVIGCILFMASVIKPAIFAGSPYVLMVSRFIAGIYMGEWCNGYHFRAVLSGDFPQKYPRFSWFTANNIQIFWITNRTVLWTFSDVLGRLLSWHWIAVVAFGTALFQAIAIPFCPPSPRYLLIFAGQEGKAREALKKLRDHADMINEELEEMQSEYRAEKSRPKFSALQFFTSPELRKPFLLVNLLQIAQQFSGVSVVIMYTQMIFSQAGLPPSDASYGSIGVAGLMATSAFISMWVVDRMGRRRMMLFGYLGMAVSWVGLTTTFVLKAPVDNEPLEKLRSAGAVISLLLVMTCASSGPSPITYFLASELFTQGPRPLAMGCAFFVNRVSGFLLLFLYPHVQALLGDYTFVLFVAVCVCNLLAVYFFVPETKKRTFEEIASGFAKTESSGNDEGEDDDEIVICNGTAPLTKSRSDTVPSDNRFFILETQV